MSRHYDHSFVNTETRYDCKDKGTPYHGSASHERIEGVAIILCPMLPSPNASH